MKLFNGNLEEKVLVELMRGYDLDISAIIKKLNSGSHKATKQGIYRVIRKLKKEEKITVYRSKISLNDLWLLKLRNSIESARSKSLIGNIAELREGEKVSLNISSLTHLDQVWSNLFIEVESETAKKIPLYLFNPHNWTMLFRNEVDLLHIKRLSKNKRRAYLTIGNDTNADRQTVKMNRREGIKCSINAKIKSDEYIAVLGEFLFRIKIEKSTSRSIDKAFRNFEEMDDILTKLHEIDKNAIGKIIIERNKKKVEIWIKRLRKDF